VQKCAVALCVLVMACEGDPGGIPLDGPPPDAEAIPDATAQQNCDGCCGNGVREGAEACDDGNTYDYDGCSRDCRIERALVLQQVSFVAPGEGCDLDGNGSIDNVYSAALNSSARAFLDDLVSRQDLQQCIYTSLWMLTGSDGTFAQGSFDFTFLLGGDVEMPPVPADYFSGSEPFYVMPDGLDTSGRPLATLAGSASQSNLTIAPGTITMPFPYCFNEPSNRIPFVYTKAQFTGVLTQGADGPTRFDGRFCAALSAQSMARIPNGLGVGGTNLLDIFVTGINYLGYRVTPTQPDYDVDQDGLETFQDTDGDGNIDLCIDGNGTQIAGVACPMDPRIVDAYSEAFDVVAIGARLAGRAP
jgi:cysteine-rich repeat protein